MHESNQQPRKATATGTPASPVSHMPWLTAALKSCAARRVRGHAEVVAALR